MSVSSLASTVTTPAAYGVPERFHPAVREWFRRRFPDGPTEAQAGGWPAIVAGRHTLVCAPTGSGKTLAGFLAAIDGLYQAHEAGEPIEGVTRVVYLSPRFHDALLAAGGNALLEKMCAMVLPELVDFRRNTHALPGAPARSGRGHAAIVEAIHRHDSDGARSAMIDHLWWLYERVQQTVREASNPGARDPAHVAPR